MNKTLGFWVLSGLASACMHQEPTVLPANIKTLTVTWTIAGSPPSLACPFFGGTEIGYYHAGESSKFACTDGTLTLNINTTSSTDASLTLYDAKHTVLTSASLAAQSATSSIAVDFPAPAIAPESRAQQPITWTIDGAETGGCERVHATRVVAKVLASTGHALVRTVDCEGGQATLLLPPDSYSGELWLTDDCGNVLSPVLSLGSFSTTLGTYTTISRDFASAKFVSPDSLSLCSPNEGSSASAPSVVALSVGADHVCARLADATLRCWGTNSSGDLGDGSFTAKRALSSPVLQLADVAAVSAGDNQTCALSSNGHGWCWGANYSALVGDGTTRNRAVPTPVVGLTNALAIAAGPFHTCAIRDDGTVACWGENFTGQLGDGTSEAYQRAPVAVVGVANAVAIGAGYDLSCALQSDGQVACWSQWQNTAAVVPGVTDATRLSVGYDTICVVHKAGVVSCWRPRTDSTPTSYPLGVGVVPTPVAGLTDVAEIAVGTTHACARKTNGTVVCWGDNSFGQLGDGTTTARSTPVFVGTLGSVDAIAVGKATSCAHKTDGSIVCWGANGQGQLGRDGADSSVPTVVQGLAVSTQ